MLSLCIFCFSHISSHHDWQPHPDLNPGASSCHLVKQNDTRKVKYVTCGICPDIMLTGNVWRVESYRRCYCVKEDPYMCRSTKTCMCVCLSLEDASNKKKSSCCNERHYPAMQPAFWNQTLPLQFGPNQWTYHRNATQTM